MNGDGSVSEEGANTREGGGVVVNVICVVAVASDGGIDRTVLSREVTHLASLGEFGITGRSLATLIWVKMA